MVAYKRGRLAPMTTKCSPRRKPRWCRPAAKSRTSWASCAHVVVCQMPYSFSRIAGAFGRLWACAISNWGKVVFMRVSNNGPLVCAVIRLNGIVCPCLTLCCLLGDNLGAKPLGTFP